MALLSTSQAFASGDDDDNDRHYGGRNFEVTITNLTRGQSFTPILVASHRGTVDLFTLGEPASDSLTALAEGGNTAPLATELEANPRVMEVANSGGLLGPGESVSVVVAGGRGVKRITLASMAIPTNDGFIALDSVRAPRGQHAVSYVIPVYDAGTETNDESCANIPGPVCGGNGPSPEDDGEGYVHIHAGIHGIGDLSAADFDWRNPAVKVTIRRVR